MLSLRRMFYLVLPSESSYKSINLIPNFVTEAIPFFLLMIVIELMIIYRKQWKYTNIDWSDSISSISAGILSQLPLIFSRSAEILIYNWIYQYYHLIKLPHDSPMVWLLGMLSVDFGYYWAHRAGHEISLFWGGHQAHHSSQRYNLSTALRQGYFQRWFSWIFYLPFALILPPTVFIVHLQFNLLYQFWIHTELITTLGPLELILNTPSHHRVHHGRNRYCIDKNYGGTLIIFDRIFGTFSKEEEDEKVVYGHVHPIETWNPIEIQLVHFKYVFHRFINTNGVANKFKVLFFGPGWINGDERLGLLKDIPEPEKPTKFYQQNISTADFVYCFINFVAANVAFSALSVYKYNLEMEHLLTASLMIVFTLVQIGRKLDGKQIFWSECIRIICGFGIVLKWF